MCVSGYAEEVTSIDKVEYLVSQGIPEDLIRNAPTKQIDDMYASFFGKSIEYLGTETKTYVGNFSKNTTINANYLHNKNPIGFSVGFSVMGFQVVANVGGLSDSVATSITISYK